MTNQHNESSYVDGQDIGLRSFWLNQIKHMGWSKTSCYKIFRMLLQNTYKFHDFSMHLSQVIHISYTPVNQLTFNKQEVFPHRYFWKLRLFASAYGVFLFMENKISIRFLTILHCSKWKIIKIKIKRRK